MFILAFPAGKGHKGIEPYSSPVVADDLSNSLLIEPRRSHPHLCNRIHLRRGHSCGCHAVHDERKRKYAQLH